MDRTISQKYTKENKEKKKKLDRIYEKKPLVEFIVAILSIPSILLLLILNFNSIRNINSIKSTPTPTSGVAVSVPGANPNFFVQPVDRAPRLTQSLSGTQTPCNKSLGPVSITSPSEGAIMNNNPVEIDISYDDTDYCSAVWSYSINGGSWSDYDNKSVALYNLPNGPVQFQLRVKSLTSSDATTLTRNFVYNGQTTATNPTNASGSAH